MINLLETRGLLIMLGGFLWAVVFGLLSFKKEYFLAISFIGWGISFVGNDIDSRQTVDVNENLCSEPRNDLGHGK